MRGTRLGDLATTEANGSVEKNDATDLVHAINEESWTFYTSGQQISFQQSDSADVRGTTADKIQQID